MMIKLKSLSITKFSGALDLKLTSFGSATKSWWTHYSGSGSVWEQSDELLRIKARTITPNHPSVIVARFEWEDESSYLAHLTIRNSDQYLRHHLARKLYLSFSFFSGEWIPMATGPALPMPDETYAYVLSLLDARTPGQFSRFIKNYEVCDASVTNKDRLAWTGHDPVVDLAEDDVAALESLRDGNWVAPLSENRNALNLINRLAYCKSRTEVCEGVKLIHYKILNAGRFALELLEGL